LSGTTLAVAAGRRRDCATAVATAATGATSATTASTALTRRTIAADRCAHRLRLGGALLAVNSLVVSVEVLIVIV
jgi:hypothetical protein